MTDQQSKLNNIEKYTGSFSKQDGGCSIIINKTINSIKSLDALGLYIYLSCRPDSWILNIKHLASHFECGKDKIYKCIKILIALGLLTRNETREKGQFVKLHYQLFLEINEINIEHIVHEPPLPEKPDTVKPDTEKADAYKTKNILNKESIFINKENPLPVVICQKRQTEISVKKKPISLTLKEMVQDNPHSIPDTDIEEWKGYRKSPITARVWQAINREMEKLKNAGITPIQAFHKMLEKPWQSLEYSFFEQQIKSQSKAISNQDMNYALGDRSEYGF